MGPVRFAEWSQAAWQMQLEHIRSGNTWDVRFMSCYHRDNAADMTASREMITGKLLHQWSPPYPPPTTSLGTS